MEIGPLKHPELSLYLGTYTDGPSHDWRAMLDKHAPGYEEYRQVYDEPAERRMLTPEIRAELVEFDDEELLTTDVHFLWRKPGR